MTNIQLKIQRLGNAIQLLSDEYQDLLQQLEPPTAPVRRRRLKAKRTAKYESLIRKPKN